MPRSFTNLRYHIVFGTKMRLPFIKPEFREELYRYIGGIVVRNGGVAIAINGIEDHVHLLVGLTPDPSVAKIVQLIKGGSSNWINKTGKSQDHFGWQEGYGAFTVSESQVPVVRRYIERQEEHHREMSFKEETLKLYRMHNIDFKDSDLD